MTDKPENPQAYLNNEDVQKAGGFAYPQFPDRQFHVEGCGMTLRDYFAGQALVGTISATFAETWDPEHIAGQCYYLADAMLLERGK